MTGPPERPALENVVRDLVHRDDSAAYAIRQLLLMVGRDCIHRGDERGSERVDHRRMRKAGFDTEVDLITNLERITTARPFPFR